MDEYEEFKGFEICQNAPLSRHDLQLGGGHLSGRKIASGKGRAHQRAKRQAVGHQRAKRQAAVKGRRYVKGRKVVIERRQSMAQNLFSGANPC